MTMSAGPCARWLADRYRLGPTYSEAYALLKV